MHKIISSLLIIPFILTNIYALEPTGETYCPLTQVAVNGKCQPVNYVDPLYWILLIILMPTIVIPILIFKSKAKNTKN